jgi:hypothetical protein
MNTLQTNLRQVTKYDLIRFVFFYAKNMISLEVFVLVNNLIIESRRFIYRFNGSIFLKLTNDDFH